MKLARLLVIGAVSLVFTGSQAPAQIPVGNCGEVHGGTGCSDSVCESCVCGEDFFCCFISWDSVCVEDLAFGTCLSACTEQPAEPDSDGDGVPDSGDVCPNSDIGLTVVIDGCDSGADNTITADGCTLSDEIATCADDARNHGAYVRCVSHFTNALKANGELSEEEKDALQSCAGQADIP